MPLSLAPLFGPFLGGLASKRLCLWHLPRDTCLTPLEGVYSGTFISLLFQRPNLKTPLSMAPLTRDVSDTFGATEVSVAFQYHRHHRHDHHRDSRT